MSEPRRSRVRPESLPIIGWREWVRLPGLGIDFIKAKVDTGARTSSLHAFDLEEFVRDGIAHVRFMIHPEQRKPRPEIPAELPLLARRRVRDSGGKVELRPIVETQVELHGRRWPIELTLTRRDAMGFRMLLGRQAIRGHFIVDPSGSYYAGKRPRRKRSS
ncbi:MAG: ATP-dependent zinc protease [Gemmatimonadota bacterium]